MVAVNVPGLGPDPALAYEGKERGGRMALLHPSPLAHHQCEGSTLMRHPMYKLSRQPSLWHMKLKKLDMTVHIVLPVR